MSERKKRDINYIEADCCKHCIHLVNNSHQINGPEYDCVINLIKVDTDCICDNFESGVKV